MKRFLYLMLICAMIAGCSQAAEASVTTQEDAVTIGEAVYLNFEDSDVSMGADGVATISNSDVDNDFVYSAGKYKYAYMPVSYLSATEVRVGGIGEGLLCVGLAAGVEEIGTASGNTLIDTETDYMRFRFPMPDTFYDGGVAGDFELAVDVSSSNAATPSSNLQIRVFERDNATPIFDGLEATGTVDLGFVMNAITMSGTNTSLDKNDVLTVEVTTVGANDDAAIRGARLKYRPGIDID